MPYDKRSDPRHKEPLRIDRASGPPRNWSHDIDYYWYCPPPPDDTDAWGIPGDKYEVLSCGDQQRWNIFAWVAISRRPDHRV